MNKEQRHPQRKPPNGWRYYQTQTQRRSILGEIYTNVWRMVKVNGALVAALIALFGVLLTGVMNTYIAEQSRKLTAELEEQRAQEVALQTYLATLGACFLTETCAEHQQTAK